jgi:hypothetical protein
VFVRRRVAFRRLGFWDARNFGEARPWFPAPDAQDPDKERIRLGVRRYCLDCSIDLFLREMFAVSYRNLIP